jgi:hypothetical protein
MIEIYNDNNLKVYADSDEYITVVKYRIVVGYYRINYNNHVILDVKVADGNGCTVTIKGDKLTLEGDVSYGSLYKDIFNVTLKGNIHLRAYNSTGSSKTNFIYNLYGESFMSVYEEKNTGKTHAYNVYNKAQLIVNAYDVNIECDIIAYDEAKVEVYGTVDECVVTLYDSSIAVVKGSNASVYSYDNSIVDSDEMAEVYTLGHAISITDIEDE